jgi:hypothetical protein
MANTAGVYAASLPHSAHVAPSARLEVATTAELRPSVYTVTAGPPLLLVLAREQLRLHRRLMS